MWLASQAKYLEAAAALSRFAGRTVTVSEIHDRSPSEGHAVLVAAVLESQRLALQAEGDLISARRLRLENRVDLYLALGGGFSQPRSVSGSQP